MASSSRHSAPMLVQAGQSARSLHRIELGRGEQDGERRESFVQELVHEHPSIIPMLDIEPAFTPLISICRELPSSAGYLDNLWMTPAGGIVLGECKLLRNPQARREVVSQALDYARAIRGWHFDDLERAAQAALRDPSIRLWNLVRAGTETGDEELLDEPQFVDAVERRLRFGRFMVLIIGDGIQEGVEALAEFLQLHAGLHIGLALVDLSIWRDEEDRLLVVPRIPLRTVLVERGIVIVEKPLDARIEPPPAAHLSTTASPPRTITASEPEFLDGLEQRQPGLGAKVREFAALLPSVGIDPEFRRSLILRWHPDPDTSASAGYLDGSGRMWLADAWVAASRQGVPEAGDRYLHAVAELIGGGVRHRERSSPIVVGPDGRVAHISELLEQRDGWLAAIAELVRACSSQPD